VFCVLWSILSFYCRCHTCASLSLFSCFSGLVRSCFVPSAFIRSLSTSPCPRLPECPTFFNMFLCFFHHLPLLSCFFIYIPYMAKGWPRFLPFIERPKISFEQNSGFLGLWSWCASPESGTSPSAGRSGTKCLRNAWEHGTGCKCIGYTQVETSGWWLLFSDQDPNRSMSRKHSRSWESGGQLDGPYGVDVLEPSAHPHSHLRSPQPHPMNSPQMNSNLNSPLNSAYGDLGIPPRKRMHMLGYEVNQVRNVSSTGRRMLIPFNSRQ